MINKLLSTCDLFFVWYLQIHILQSISLSYIQKSAKAVWKTQPIYLKVHFTTAQKVHARPHMTCFGNAPSPTKRVQYKLVVTNRLTFRQSVVLASSLLLFASLHSCVCAPSSPLPWMLFVWSSLWRASTRQTTPFRSNSRANMTTERPRDGCATIGSLPFTGLWPMSPLSLWAKSTCPLGQSHSD